MKKMDATAKFVLEKIESTGYDAFIVGGAVRDLLMDKDPSDYDIVTSCPQEVLNKIFPLQHDIGKNKDFGITVIDIDGQSFEIAQYRQDIYNDTFGHGAETVKFVSTLKEDLARRDFTINAMAMSASGTIFDYFNGQDDLKNGIIRTVGDPDQRFNEDWIRMLRAVRFVNKHFNFKFDSLTRYTILENAHRIKEVAPERIQKELFKMAESKYFFRAVSDMMVLGLLNYILPEVNILTEFKHGLRHHPEGFIVRDLSNNEFAPYNPKVHTDLSRFIIAKEGNVFDHVISALKNSNHYEKYSSPTTCAIINLAILFHDVGKAVTYSFDEVKNKIHYIGHEEKGVQIIENICQRLAISNDVKSILTYCCRNHMVFHDILKMKKSRLIRLIHSQHFEILVWVAMADDMSRNSLFDPLEWRAKMSRISAVKQEWPKERFDTLNQHFNGDLIMQIKNIKPNRIIGKIKMRTIDRVIDLGISDEEAIQYIKGFNV